MTILKSVRHLDSFGLLWGNTLAMVIFQEAAKPPHILSTEFPRVIHADLFVDNDVATKSPNSGAGIIKAGMKNSQTDLVWLRVA